MAVSFLASIAQRAFIRAGRAFIRAHGFLYRTTGGRIGARLFGNPVLLLTTRGRRSGKLRTTPLLYIRDGRDFVVVASNGGEARHPDWWYNLQSHPEATIQVLDETMHVRSQQATPEEKRRLWPLLVGMYPTYAEYQKKTTRDIPLAVLRPVEAQRQDR
jgi:deazaflavin-dependent oxidoreductase (nitroreductase family)